MVGISGGDIGFGLIDELELCGCVGGFIEGLEWGDYGQ